MNVMKPKSNNEDAVNMPVEIEPANWNEIRRSPMKTTHLGLIVTKPDPTIATTSSAPG